MEDFISFGRNHYHQSARVQKQNDHGSKSTSESGYPKTQKQKRKTQKTSNNKDSATEESKAKRQATLSAYIIWCSEERRKLHREMIGRPPREVTKCLGATWRMMSDEEKEPYKEKEKQLKEKYEAKFGAPKIPKRQKKKRALETVDYIPIEKSAATVVQPQPIVANATQLCSSSPSTGTLSRFAPEDETCVLPDDLVNVEPIRITEDYPWDDILQDLLEGLTI